MKAHSWLPVARSPSCPLRERKMLRGPVVLTGALVSVGRPQTAVTLRPEQRAELRIDHDNRCRFTAREQARPTASSPADSARTEIKARRQAGRPRTKPKRCFLIARLFHLCFSISWSHVYRILISLISTISAFSFPMPDLVYLDSLLLDSSRQRL